MLGQDDQVRYDAWLIERYPLTHRHYRSWARSLIRAVGEQPDTTALESWLKSYAGQSRRSARKGLRRLVQWAQSEGIAAPSVISLKIHAPSRTLSAAAAEILSKKK